MKEVAYYTGVGFAIGVFWFAWEHVGFLRAMLYGLFFDVWIGYRFAEWLWR